MRVMFGGQTDAHDYHYARDLAGVPDRFVARSGVPRASNPAATFGEFEDMSDVRFQGQLVSLNMEAYK